METSYGTCSKLSLHWLDIRVFYVRLSNFTFQDSTPECLTLNHIPLSPDTPLEVNGARCIRATCVLRRDRIDKKSEEITFVSTDSVRLTGSVKFDVFDAEKLMLTGVLEMCSSNGFVDESKNNAGKWRINCESGMSGGIEFCKKKQIEGSQVFLPTIEVYVAGSFLGAPVILVKTLQLITQKRQNRNGMLDSIPEYGANGSYKDIATEHNLQVQEYRNYKTENGEDYNNLYWRQTEYIEGEYEELSWFNAGVRVGVGIGLGVCLGVGIGVGLLVRTYQATSRNFKRRLT